MKEKEVKEGHNGLKYAQNHIEEAEDKKRQGTHNLTNGLIDKKED